MSNSLVFKFKTDILDILITKDLNNPFGLEIPEIAKVAAKELKEKDFDLNHLVNGHDLSNLLMKKVFKSRNRMLVNNSLEDSLILSYEFDF